MDTWVFPDPVFGPTVFAGIEKKLIETAEVNRLLYIKQLSTVYFWYPSADYTRFEHSLGMARLVKDFLFSALQRPRPGIGEISDLVCAAILHDIGHAAWSHAGELFARYKTVVFDGRTPDHDTLSAALIRGDERLTEHFDQYGLPLVSQVLKEADRTKIAQLVQGEPPIREASHTPIQSEQEGLRLRYQARIIASPFVDLDRVAYLIRDAFYVAGSASFFSLKDVLESLVVSKTKRGANELVFGSIPFAESFILTRELMYAAIYNDPRNLVAEEMLARAFCLCYEDCGGAGDLLRIWFKTDHEMWEDMKNNPKSERIAVLVRNRNPYTVIWRRSFRDLAEEEGEGVIEKLEDLASDKPNILALEDELATESGLEAEKLILCIFRRTEERKVPDITESLVRTGGKFPREIRDLSPLIKSMDHKDYEWHRSFVALAVDPDVGENQQITQRIVNHFAEWRQQS